MASLPEKAIGLGVSLVAAALLLNVVTEKIGAGATLLPRGAPDGALIAVGATVAALGFIGRRWFARRFMEPRATERRTFTERRRAEPPPPNFHAE